MIILLLQVRAQRNLAYDRRIDNSRSAAAYQRFVYVSLLSLFALVQKYDFAFGACDRRRRFWLAPSAIC